MRSMPRWLARAPIWLFQARLGGLAGGRFIMLDHRGRRSGLVRHVVLEAVANQPDGIVVVSGYGRSAQWLQNVQADPRVRLWQGWQRPRSAVADVLSTSQTRAVLEDYRHRHPAAARMLAAGFDLPELAAGDTVPVELVEQLPAVLLGPRTGPRPGSG